MHYHCSELLYQWPQHIGNQILDRKIEHDGHEEELTTSSPRSDPTKKSDYGKNLGSEGSE
jgi:hypothetical protein